MFRKVSSLELGLNLGRELIRPVEGSVKKRFVNSCVTVVTEIRIKNPNPPELKETSKGFQQLCHWALKPAVSNL